MGMESYDIILLPENVNIIRENEYWKLCGASEWDIRIIEDKLMELCKKDEYKNYIMDECVEIKLYDENMFFQGFELRGCLSYLKGGVEQCYKFYKFWENKIPLRVFVMNQKIFIENAEDLYETVSNFYLNKLKIFKKQYGNIELKVTCGNFYKEINKKKKWYYKLFSLDKNGEH